jgi:inner membrane protein
MLFRTHLVFSIGLSFLFYYLIEVPNFLIFFSFVLISTLLVDVDSKKSFVGHYLIFRPIQFFVSHRGFIHSLLFGGFFSLLILRIDVWAGVGFFLGFSSHLFLDSLTKRGVRVFYPLSNFKLSFGLRSGGILEDIIFVLFFLIDILFFLCWLWNSLF